MTITDLRIAAVAYALPREVESVRAILERETARVETALMPLAEQAREKALAGLGLERVRVCGCVQPYDLIVDAASRALAEAGVSARDVNMLIDFSTLPGKDAQYLSLAHRLSADLGADDSLNLGFKAGGCAGLHLAIKTALAWMSIDARVRTALLVCGDSPPEGNRTLLPVTVQGDAASAVVVSRDSLSGPLLLDVEVMTLGHLHQAISLAAEGGRLEIRVDAACIEREVTPVYYLNLLRLIDMALAKSSLTLADVDHFVYSNISQRDREGFRRALRLPENKLPATAMPEYGHTFASDLVINYSDLQREGRVRPGQLMLFASAGIGFTWGVTLART